MKRILVVLTLLFFGITGGYGQATDTKEVQRVTRRINDFDIYDTASQKKERPVTKTTPVIENVIEEKIEQPKPILASLEKELSDGSYYSVQVAACREPLSQEYLDYRNYLEVYGSDGWYRYFSSRFFSLREAKNYQYEIQSTTKFKDAFPVRIKDFIKIGLREGL